MPVTYKNRRGQLYYLHTGKTKTGKPRWFMSTKSAGKWAGTVPEGYEVWENPADAQVFVRKIPPRIITDAELQMVQDLARSNIHTRYTIVDVNNKAIIVYAATDDLAARIGLMSGFGDPDPAGTRRFMEQGLYYQPMLRFVLENPTDRVFLAYRWCFLGSIDDWFMLDSGPLVKLAAEYIPHIGAESFYELM